MGHKIGVPSLKLNNVGNKSKHCGSFGGVAYEGLEERLGLDKDINPELSQFNVYTGYRSAAELMEYSQRHLQELKDASGRGIRKDAVVMCATIFKPPAVYMNSLSIEEQQRLLGDCLEFFKPVVGEKNIKSTAQHYDEQGGHMHVFWEPMTDDGRLCAKEVHNIKLFGYINEHLPAFLRERGWEIDDADCYDRAQREYEDQKAQEEHYQKRKEQGRSSAVYKNQAEKEKQALVKENEELRSENSRLLGAKGLLEIQNAELREEGVKIESELNEMAELKTLAEYQAQVVENDYVISGIAGAVRAAAEQVKAEGYDLNAAQRFINAILAGMARMIEALRIQINRVKLFEKLHNLFERAGVRQERTLEAVLDNAYQRAGGNVKDGGQEKVDIGD